MQQKFYLEAGEYACVENFMWALLRYVVKFFICNLSIKFIYQKNHSNNLRSVVSLLSIQLDLSTRLI